MFDIFACIGLHWIIKYGSILNIPRDLICKIPIFKVLLECSLCLGFWCGVAISIYNEKFSLLFGFVGSFCCWFFDNLNNLIQRIDLKLENDS